MQLGLQPIIDIILKFGRLLAVEPYHLTRYLDEYCFRFNNRKATDADRFELLTGMIVDKRLTYAELTGKVPATA